MITTKIGRAAGLGAVAIVAALGFAAAVSAPTPAEARVFGGFRLWFSDRISVLLSALPLSAAGLLSATAALRSPGLLSGARDSKSAVRRLCCLRGAGSPAITYTPRRGWTNAQGEYCRECRTTQPSASRATEHYGTACRDARGQWRIAN